MKRLALALLVAAAAAHAGSPAVAQTKAAAGGPTEMTDGEIRKVDKDGAKLTIRHGEIKNLDMPPMTMVFVVKDTAVLDKLQPGAKIRFKAVNDGGRLTATEIVAVK